MAADAPTDVTLDKSTPDSVWKTVLDAQEVRRRSRLHAVTGGCSARWTLHCCKDPLCHSSWLRCRWVMALAFCHNILKVSELQFDIECPRLRRSPIACNTHS